MRIEIKNHTNNTVIYNSCSHKENKQKRLKKEYYPFQKVEGL